MYKRQELVNKGLILAGHDISAGGLITTLLEMCFANVEGGSEINLYKIKEQDLIKILFAENPGIVIQVSDKHKDCLLYTSLPPPAWGITPS